MAKYISAEPSAEELAAFAQFAGSSGSSAFMAESSGKRDRPGPPPTLGHPLTDTVTVKPHSTVMNQYSITNADLTHTCVFLWFVRPKTGQGKNKMIYYQIQGKLKNVGTHGLELKNGKVIINWFDGATTTITPKDA
jgi:hypothetical protein